MRGCRGFLVDSARTLGFGAAVLVQLVLVAWAGYDRYYRPLAEAPGARDGAGLLFVLAAVGVGSVVVTTVIVYGEVLVLKQFFPGWEPPDPND